MLGFLGMMAALGVPPGGGRESGMIGGARPRNRCTVKCPCGRVISANKELCRACNDRMENAVMDAFTEAAVQTAHEIRSEALHG